MTAKPSGLRKGEVAYIIAIVVGLVIGVLIKRIRVGVMIGVVLCLLKGVSTIFRFMSKKR